MPPTIFTCAKPKGNWFNLAVSIFIALAGLYIAMQVADYGDFDLNRLIMLLVVLLIFSIPVLYTALTYLLTKQYMQVDGNKELELREDTRQLILTCGSKKFTINSEDIDNVEIFGSIPIRLSMFSYMKINMVNGGYFLISSFIANQFDLEPVIEGIKITTDKTYINIIKIATLKYAIC